MNVLSRFALAIWAIPAVMSVYGIESALAQYGAVPISSKQVVESSAAKGVTLSRQNSSTKLADVIPNVKGYSRIDAAVITGENNAAKVRVNNLAHLEALINILANGAELVGVVWGGSILVIAATAWSKGMPNLSKRFLIGGSILTVGLAIPGLINWLIASARDAGLFS